MGSAVTAHVQNANGLRFPMRSCFSISYGRYKDQRKKSNVNDLHRYLDYFLVWSSSHCTDRVKLWFYAATSCLGKTSPGLCELHWISGITLAEYIVECVYMFCHVSWAHSIGAISVRTAKDWESRIRDHAVILIRF